VTSIEQIRERQAEAERYRQELQDRADLSDLGIEADTQPAPGTLASMSLPESSPPPRLAAGGARMSAQGELMKKWTRLKTAVRGVAAVIDGEPKHLASIRASVESALELLAKGPSLEAVDEIEYLLRRVDEFIAKWRPSRKPEPGVFYVQPLWAAGTDRETQEALRLLQQIRAGGLEPESEDVQRGEAVMKVFVSHSSADKNIAGAFVELLRAALLLSAKDIRCTSVDGYKLAPGTNADEQLRREVFEAQAFVALLSPTSIKSVYVMFELGGRWGARGYLAPVMVAGLDPSYLKPPLSAIHAVLGSSEGDLHQLIDTLGEKLGLAAEKPDAYLKALQAFADAAKAP
jgi:hypothetical protein